MTDRHKPNVPQLKAESKEWSLRQQMPNLQRDLL